MVKIFEVLNNNKNCRSHCAAIPFIIVCLLTACVSDVFADGTITFSFRPPHGTTFIEKHRVERKIFFAANLGQETEITESQAEYSIKKANNKYLVSIKPIRPANLVVSDNISGVLNALVSNMNLSYELDSQGGLQRVQGVAAAMERMKGIMSEKLLDVIFDFMGQSGKTMNELVTDE